MKWAKGPDFAEMAEALGIKTDQVMMASVDNPLTTVVLYTPDPDGQPPVWRAELARDADGILVVKGTPFELPSSGSAA